MFQSFHLIPSLTALENVMLPLELRARRDAREAAAQALEQVGLTPRAAHYPKQLSGGEQQRVAIARAFVTHPSLLFADEPTGNLDTHTGQRITDLLFELNRGSGSTLVLVTHDRDLAQPLRPHARARCGTCGERELECRSCDSPCAICGATSSPASSRCCCSRCAWRFCR